MFPLSGVQVDFAFDNSETRTIHNLYILIIVWTNPNNILPMNKGFLCEELFGSGKTLKFNNFSNAQRISREYISCRANGVVTKDHPFIPSISQ